jgi:two-component system LytT family sensor kinase
MVGGALIALPAVLHGEWVTLPFNLLCGFVAGQLRHLAANHEEIWSFSPFIDLSIYRWIRRNLPKPRLFDWQIMFFITIVALRFVHSELIRILPSATYSMESPKLWVEALIYATSITVIGTELKIWNGVRLQIKLEEQERLLLHARMEALQNQINPHFLFNTLNSVSSLVRFDPDTARDLIIKLANILRRLLNSSDAFVPLREELEFIDNYLDIEVVRFGRDKLRVIKELDVVSLDAMVPSMLLQPLVENSIPGQAALAGCAHGGGNSCRALRRALQHPAVEVFVLRNNFARTKARLRNQASGLAHFAQMIFIGQ